MVHDVLTFMRNEAQEGLLYDLKAVQKRTAAATGVSERTVRRINVVANVPGASMHDAFRTPGRRRTGRKKVTALCSTKLGLLKRFIHNYHITEKELPTMKHLLKRVKEVVQFKGQASSMRRIINDLGFKWKKTEDSRKILIEQASIRQKRIEYLQATTKYRAEGRSFVFVDSCLVDTAHASDNTVKGFKKCERVIVLHAASDFGFLPGTLVTLKIGTKSDDNKQYDKWLRNQLIPNLPANAVVVVGKAPFFNKSEDAAPSSTSKRFFMESWLLEKGIPYTTTMLKPQLYKLVSTYKCGFKQYKIDGILNESDHPVLRFPPCHPDLNPLELAWASVKGYVTSKTPRDIDTAKLLVEQNISEINNVMSAHCKNIRTIEKEYGESDIAIDSLTDEVTIHVSDNESDEETDQDSGSENQKGESSSDEDEAKEAEIMEVNISPDAIIGGAENN